MEEQELLDKCKKGLGITGTYQDDTLNKLSIVKKLLVLSFVELVIYGIMEAVKLPYPHISMKE